MHFAEEVERGFIEEELHSAYQLTPEHIAFYEDFGYIKLKQVFSAGLLEHYRRIIHAKVAELSVGTLPMDQRSTYGKAFLQIMNLWTHSDGVKQLVFSRRLGRIAAELMQVAGVRLYHDQALYKEAGGGITPWHADQYYWPVDSDRTITAWIPLQTTPREMGPLAFCEKSHRFQHGRDLEIGDESELTLKQALEHFRIEDGGFDLGDVSFHSGWTFHRAGANSTDRAREVMTIIYMDEAIRVAAPKNKNHISDMARWMPGLSAGDPLASPLNPVIFSRFPQGLTSPR